MTYAEFSDLGIGTLIYHKASGDVFEITDMFHANGPEDWHSSYTMENVLTRKSQRVSDVDSEHYDHINNALEGVKDPATKACVTALIADIFKIRRKFNF